jgi:hypothetical protein
MGESAEAAVAYAADMTTLTGDGDFAPDDDDLSTAITAPPTTGRLVRVPLRQVWAHEAGNFTPWLLANAEVLGEALEMDLEITRAEHPVGKYWLDLIGTDRRTGHRVIIENQFGVSDHGHLGQLITYAAGTEAVNIVWVTEGLREEHRAALMWLNDRTSTETRFFGVEVTAVRIGDSVPAADFRPVVMPNDWEKVVRTTVQAQSVREEMYAEFWQLFRDGLACEGLSDWTTAKKSLGNWFELRAGTSNAVYGIAFGAARMRSELTFNSNDVIVNEHRYQQLFKARSAMIAAYGSELTFEAKDGIKQRRIADYRSGSIENRDEWADYVAWSIDSQRRLRRAVDAAGGMPASG